MKKKILTILMLFILFLGIIYTPVLIKADSGFDSSYDSGGSSSSSSNWGSSSSSSGSSSNYRFYGKLDLTSAIILIALLIFVFSSFIILYIRLDKALKKYDNASIENNNLLKLSDEEIKNKLPDFNIEEFNKIVFNNYKDLQDSWMNFELDTIKNLVSDEIYNMYSMQLDTLKVKGQKNMMENINFVDNYICDIKIENDTTTISTILSVTCYDYIVDSNNKVIRGNKNKELCYTYRLTFIKNNKTINTCPNCGATINSKKDTTCPYCSATIVNNNSEWIMTKKEMLKQTTK